MIPTRRAADGGWARLPSCSARPAECMTTESGQTVVLATPDCNNHISPTDPIDPTDPTTPVDPTDPIGPTAPGGPAPRVVAGGGAGPVDPTDGAGAGAGGIDPTASVMPGPSAPPPVPPVPPVTRWPRASPTRAPPAGATCPAPAPTSAGCSLPPCSSPAGAPCSSPDGADGGPDPPDAPGGLETPGGRTSAAGRHLEDVAEEQRGPERGGQPVGHHGVLLGGGGVPGRQGPPLSPSSRLGRAQAGHVVRHRGPGEVGTSRSQTASAGDSWVTGPVPPVPSGRGRDGAWRPGGWSPRRARRCRDRGRRPRPGTRRRLRAAVDHRCDGSAHPTAGVPAGVRPGTDPSRGAGGPVRVSRRRHRPGHQ